ncbi:hypothetical protein KSD_41620 [Ktedonobacter sp. SOSP1-85]|uniref:hypothetical protein n=1 Tax=Ktedonobacter sp. SOSP1-85 TaxID=2778367 RepID=UPI001916871E|nr:hypothetical protein [Ktedonobacter sp. SOSP1-85]GHO76391.1 hypothetical protein KSD_41620 [Ktedonobacter sp. SOSP1-85]
MPEILISRKFRYDLSELHTRRKKNEITEEDFSIQHDALIAQEAKLQEAAGSLLLAKELEAVDADIEASIEKSFKKKS